MRRLALPFLCLTVLLGLFAGNAGAEDPTPAAGTRCAECGMICIPDSPFTSAMTTKDGEKKNFCDVGDMLVYRSSHPAEASSATFHVRDLDSREWIPAAGAFYVKTTRFKTPMGWGIAAFKSREAAAAHGEPMSLEKVMEAVK